MATDGQFIYMHSKRDGLIKFSIGNNGQMPGIVIKQKQDFSNDKKLSLLYVNGKLYAKVNNKEDPHNGGLKVINRDTLEEEAPLNQNLGDASDRRTMKF